VTLSAQGDTLLQQLALALVPQPQLQRYVAEQPVECCSGCGTLTWWPGIMAPENEDDFTCPGRLLARLNFRLAVCWPTVDDQGNFPQTEAEAISAQLMDDLAAMSKKIIELQCLPEWRGLRLVDSFTQRPQGGCATARLEVEIVVS
jgi:hypothetical protein